MPMSILFLKYDSISTLKCLAVAALSVEATIAKLPPVSRTDPDALRNPAISASMQHFLEASVLASSLFTSDENDIHHLALFCRSRSLCLILTLNPSFLNSSATALAIATDL